MSTLVVTRANVLRALSKEPLKKGSWVYSRIAPAKTRTPCPVCAVGATLRACGVPDYLIGYTADELTGLEYAGGGCTDEEIQESLQNGDYLLALSRYFESKMPERITPKHREKLRSWVRDNFPTGVIYEGTVCEL